MDTKIEDLASGSLGEVLAKAQAAGASVKFDFGDRHDAVGVFYAEEPPTGSIWSQAGTTVDAACQKLLVNIP